MIYINYFYILNKIIKKSFIKFKYFNHGNIKYRKIFNFLNRKYLNVI